MSRNVKNKFSLFSFIFAVPSLAIWLAFLVIRLKLRIRSNSKQLVAELAPIIGEKAAKEIAEIYKAKLEEAFFKSVRGLDLLAVFSEKFRASRKT